MVLFLISILQISFSQTCAPYQCAPSDFPMPTSYCAVSFNGTFFLSPCTAPLICDIPSGQCKQPPSTPSTASYPGENCVKNSDCTSNNCTLSVCQGLGINMNCTSHDVCAPGLRCASGTCQKQLDVTQSGCLSDFDCINSAGCNFPKSSVIGMCVAYFSIPIGQEVSDCVAGESYLCKSSECVNSRIFQNYGNCKASFVSLATIPVSCSNSSSCGATDGASAVNGNCVCGYNGGGNAYCEVYSGDLPGLKYMQTWQQALVASLGVCNTVRRFEKECLVRAKTYEEVVSAVWGYQNYPWIQNNDKCVIEMITADAYSVDDVAIMVGISLYFIY